MVFQFKSPKLGSPDDAQNVGEELEELRTKNGGSLTPCDIVAEARENGILHGYFEWDDSKAAEHHRLQQARHLIGQIVVTFDEQPTGSEPIRAFISIRSESDDEELDDPDDAGSERAASFAYISTKDALRDPETRQQVIDRAYAEIRRWRKRYAALSELANIFDAIDAVAAG